MEGNNEHELHNPNASAQDDTPDQQKAAERTERTNNIVIDEHFELLTATGAIHGDVLQLFAGDKVTSQGASSQKNILFNATTNELYLITNSLEDTALRRLEAQASFYERYHEKFKGVVAPMRGKVIYRGRTVGMIQEKFGSSALEAYQNGFSSDEQTINAFVEKYRDLIHTTGFAHGDFTLGNNKADWDNLRIDQTKKDAPFRFIDYFGNFGIMVSETGIHIPQTNAEGLPVNEDYIQTRDQDPERVAALLRGKFIHIGS